MYPSPRTPVLLETYVVARVQLTTDSLGANLAAMTSVASVSPLPDLGNLTAAHSARVAVVLRDPFQVFARAALAREPGRISIVSPWVSDASRRRYSFERLVAHAERHEAGFVLVTRPPMSDAHEAVLERVSRLRRGVIRLNASLHAKLFVCEGRHGNGVALVGSANCTENSASLDEAGLLVRPHAGSQIIEALGQAAVRALSGDALAHRHERNAT